MWGGGEDSEAAGPSRWALEARAGRREVQRRSVCVPARAWHQRVLDESVDGMTRALGLGKGAVQWVKGAAWPARPRRAGGQPVTQGHRELVARQEEGQGWPGGACREAGGQERESALGSPDCRREGTAPGGGRPAAGEAGLAVRARAVRAGDRREAGPLGCCLSFKFRGAGCGGGQRKWSITRRRR